MENSSFFYALQADSEGCLINFFWADARLRIDYHHFGDVVCFDPTYGTSRYKMPFVPIVGINHHYQTVLLGGALLYYEMEESFEWVMRTWMRAMGGKKPIVILIDQESAIECAIENVLIGTRHKFCLWHITHNAMPNLPSNRSGDDDFAAEFNKCLYGNEIITQFESTWNNMLEKFNLKENKWLEKLFEKRVKWASVYTRDLLCASMYTTQQSESIKAYFKDYLTSEMTLCEFSKQFERAVTDRREKKNDDDYNNTYSKPVLKFSIGIEKDVAEAYTRSIFSKFREQLTLKVSPIVA